MSFVLEGNSIAYGYGLSSPTTQNFGYLLSGKSWFAGKGAFYNFGVNGSGIASGVALSIYDRYMTNVYPHRPTANGGDGGAFAVFYNEGGVNDLASLNHDAERVVVDLYALNTRAKSHGFYVIADTLPPTINLSIETRRLGVNAAIRAGQVGADFTLDSAQALPDPKDLNFFLADGTHLSAGGHVRRANYINEALVGGNGLIWDDHVAFCATTSLGASASSEITSYDSPRLNRGNAFDASTGRFVAQKRGVLFAQINGLDQASGGQVKLEIRKNGQLIGAAGFSSIAYDDVIASALTDVEIGDVVSVWVPVGALLPSNTQVGFMGHML